ncbi:hypothetical protein RI367_006863 [Sorochytrium milnesiophthora]
MAATTHSADIADANSQVIQVHNMDFFHDDDDASAAASSATTSRQQRGRRKGKSAGDNKNEDSMDVDTDQHDLGADNVGDGDGDGDGDDNDDDQRSSPNAALTAHSVADMDVPTVLDLEDDVIVHEGADASEPSPSFASSIASAMSFAQAAAAAPKSSPVIASSDKVWDANALFARNGNSSAQSANETYVSLKDDEFQQSAIQLLQHMVDLGAPSLTAKVTNFLKVEGVLPLLMSKFFARLPQDAPRGTFPITVDERVLRPRDQDLTDTIRSYNLMDIFCCGNASNSDFIEAHFDVIVNGLFDVFLPESDGNFHHFRQILESFLQRFPFRVYTATLFTEQADPSVKPLIFRMLPYLHEAAVQSALLSWMTFKSKTGPPNERPRRFAQLQNLGFFEALTDLIKSDLSELLTGVREFMSRLVEDLTSVENSNILFLSVAVDKSVVAKLVDSCLQGSERQRRALVTVLHELAISSVPKPLMPNTPHMPQGQDTPSNLAPTAKGLVAMLQSHVPSLCTLLTDDVPAPSAPKSIYFSGFAVERPFDPYRLRLLEMLYEVLRSAPADDTTALSSIPSSFWQALVNWFFDCRFNSHFQALFYKISTVVIRSNNTESIRELVTKTKLLTRMIEHYYNTEVKSEARGHIILICNTLRLAAESETPINEYLRSLLPSHPKWREFQTTLREVTEQQTFIPPTFSQLVRKPLPHFGPLNVDIIFEEAYSGYDRQIGPNVVCLSDEQVTGIDLGSKYALCLGFRDKVRSASEEQAYMAATVAATLEAELLADEDTNAAAKKKGAKKKKNKNKKNKKKNAAAAAAAAATDAAETANTASARPTTSSKPNVILLPAPPSVTAPPPYPANTSYRASATSPPATGDREVSIDEDEEDDYFNSGRQENDDQDDEDDNDEDDDDDDDDDEVR